MKIKTRFIVCICLICLTVSFMSCGNCVDNDNIVSESNKEEYKIFPDYPHYDSIDELAESSDIIVYGEVISKTCEERSLLIEEEGVEYTEEQLNDKDVVTISEVKISEEYIGALNSAEISVIQLGGETEQKKVYSENSPNLEKDSSYVFFLKKSQKWDNTYWLLNETQSAFAVNKDATAIESGMEGLTFDWLNEYYKSASHNI